MENQDKLIVNEQTLNKEDNDEEIGEAQCDDINVSIEPSPSYSFKSILTSNFNEFTGLFNERDYLTSLKDYGFLEKDWNLMIESIEKELMVMRLFLIPRIVLIIVVIASLILGIIFILFQIILWGFPTLLSVLGVDKTIFAFFGSISAVTIPIGIVFGLIIIVFIGVSLFLYKIIYNKLSRKKEQIINEQLNEQYNENKEKFNNGINFELDILYKVENNKILKILFMILPVNASITLTIQEKSEDEGDDRQRFFESQNEIIERLRKGDRGNMTSEAIMDIEEKLKNKNSIKKDPKSIAATVYGKIKVVDSFPDYKVKIVNSFPDLKVKKVTSFPDKCGLWKFVDSFPDYKIKFVDSFPDFKIKYVDSFPGV